jgi:hypothetical protein
MSTFFPSFVSEEDKIIIMEEVLKDELETVLHYFQNDEILGFDGWSVELFLGFQKVIEAYLLRVVEESRISGKVLSNFNATFIALIPQK